MTIRSQLGFTLYELLITVVIVGIVLGFGVPNLIDFTRNSRMTSTANDLHASFQLARTEAARARSNITICASANPLGNNSDCDGTWDQGYIVFVDADGDLSRSGTTETVLRAHPPVESGVNLRFANDSRYFSFAPTGLGRGDVGDDPAGLVYGRQPATWMGSTTDEVTVLEFLELIAWPPIEHLSQVV